MGRSIKSLPWVVVAIAVLCSLPGLARATPQNDQNQPTQPDQSAQTKKNGKVKQKSEKDLYNELDSQYKKWLNEDVVYIISPEERRSFLHLGTNEEREQFIEAFWQRRNPDPESPDNTF